MIWLGINNWVSQNFWVCTEDIQRKCYGQLAQGHEISDRHSLLNFGYLNAGIYSYLMHHILCQLNFFFYTMLSYTIQCLYLFTIKLLCSFTMNPIYLNFRFPVPLRVWGLLEIDGEGNMPLMDPRNRGCPPEFSLSEWDFLSLNL